MVIFCFFVKCRQRDIVQTDTQRVSEEEKHTQRQTENSTIHLSVKKNRLVQTKNVLPFHRLHTQSCHYTSGMDRSTLDVGLEVSWTHWSSGSASSVYSELPFQSKHTNYHVNISNFSTYCRASDQQLRKPKSSDTNL